MNVQHLSGLVSRNILDVFLLFFNGYYHFEKHEKLYIGILFSHPYMAGFRSSNIPDQGPPDGNPTIALYSRFVRVLAGF